jgi:hypothetical protein
MSNRLSIVVNRVVQRHDPENPFNEIVIFDDYGSFDIFLDQEDAPTNPGDLLKKIIKEVKNTLCNSDFMELLSTHINDRPGLEIEGDWIEWDDPRLAEAMKEWHNDNDEDKFNIGDSVIVPNPLHEDPWDHSFTGTIKAFKEDTDGTHLATVEDQEGDCWDIEVSRLKMDAE